MEWPWKWKKKEPATSLNDSKIYLRDEFARERLVDADLMLLVSQPPSIDHNEWLATHVMWFVEHVNLLCGALSEFCQTSTCPTMSVPGNILQWVDDKNKKRPCSAPDYINLVMNFAHGCLKDDTIFPTKYGQSFANDAEVIMRKIVRLLLHALAHIYHAHYRTVLQLGLIACINTVTYHLMAFSKTFRLIEDRDFQLLGDLFKRLQQVAPVHDVRHSLSANGIGTSQWVDGSSL